MRDGGRDLRDGADLRRQVRGQQVHVAGEVLPGACGARHVGLTAEPSLDADFARDRRHLVGEGRQRLRHVVDRRCEGRHFALRVDGQLLFQVAVGDRRDDLDDAANLFGQVCGHDVDVVGEVLPGAGDAGHAGLPAEPALGADLARDARDFRRERVELVHHRVDRVLELENLALDVDRDLAREVALGDGRRDLRDVAHLRREVRGQQVDVVGEVLPRAGDARHAAWPPSLPSVPTSRATRVTSAANDRSWSTIVFSGVFEEQDLAADVDRDLLGQVAGRDRRRDLGDVAHLRRQVAGHEVDVVGEVFPGAGHAGHDRLTAELAFGADLARDARDFRRERP